MNEHSTPQPATAGTPPVPSIDLVAGDPSVPITVWRTARSDQDTSRSVPARLAYRMVAAYNHPGEAVIDLTDGHALTGVAVTGGRVHHKAWLSDVATPTAVIAAETATGPSRSSKRSRYAPRSTTAWPWPSVVLPARLGTQSRHRRGADLVTRWTGRPPSTADCTARAENPYWCGCRPGTSPPHLAAPQRLGWGLLSDER